MWILTKEYNDYNQHGVYFLVAFLSKPTFKQLKDITKEDDVTVGKLSRGGGRQDREQKWYHVTEVKDGEKPKPARLAAFTDE